MNRTSQKKGFTMIEIMLVISIIGFLAALGIPSAIKAYANAQDAARERNISAVESAKSTLTLPPGLMTGAMGLTPEDDFGDTAESNLFVILKISDISELTVGNATITIGDLTTRAYY